MTKDEVLTAKATCETKTAAAKAAQEAYPAKLEAARKAFNATCAALAKEVSDANTAAFECEQAYRDAVTAGLSTIESEAK